MFVVLMFFYTFFFILLNNSYIYRTNCFQLFKDKKKWKQFTNYLIIIIFFSVTLYPNVSKRSNKQKKHHA